MRIISGILKGRKIVAPKSLPVRPTTDFAKEALFNLLNNQIKIEGAKVLDLCAGTGNISFEFTSRGAVSVISVDAHAGCLKFIKQQADAFQINTIHPYKADLFQYLKRVKKSFNIIFADPPYEMEGLEQLPELILSRKLLEKNGLLIVEHSKKIKFEEQAGFLFSRKYGNVNFTFFEEIEA